MFESSKRGLKETGPLCEVSGARDPDLSPWSVQFAYGKNSMRSAGEVSRPDSLRPVPKEALKVSDDGRTVTLQMRAARGPGSRFVLVSYPRAILDYWSR